MKSAAGLCDKFRSGIIPSAQITGKPRSDDEVGFPVCLLYN